MASPKPNELSTVDWNKRHVCRHVCGHVCRHVCRRVCVDMCVDICMGMCVDMCVDMCIDLCIDMGTGLCTDLCTDLCIDLCADLCIDMCIDICPAMGYMNNSNSYTWAVAFMNGRMRWCVRACLQTRLRTCLQLMSHARLHTGGADRADPAELGGCAPVSSLTCTHTCRSMHACARACVFVCARARVPCARACMAHACRCVPAHPLMPEPARTHTHTVGTHECARDFACTLCA